MHKFGRAIIIAAVVTSMVVTPVYATEEVVLTTPEATAPVDTGVVIDESADIDTLRAQLTDMLTRIDEIEKESVTKGEEINLAQKDLEEAEGKEKSQYEAMKLRIRYMYETGNSGILEAILNAQNIVDALNKAEYASDISNYDRNMILTYVDTQNQIKSLKTTLETEQKQLVALKDAFNEQQTSLSALIEQKQAEMDAAQFQQIFTQALMALNTDEEFQQLYEVAVETGDYTVIESYSGASSFSSTVWNSIIDAAYSQIGVGYVYGSQNPGVSFDCSGFVQYCYAQAGIDIPRSSGEIAANGTVVSADEAQPGDIMWEEGHVLIYLGDGKCIDSKTEGTTIDVRDINTNKDYTYIRY